jgi:cytidylate kinase
MNIITISREFGSGGRELGKRLADIMNFDYYDSEIIAAVAKKSGLDTKYAEGKLNNHGWKNIPITFRSTIGSATYMQSGKVTLLLEQKKVIEEIATLGKDCIIVGRNADVILKKYNLFNIFVCAAVEAKVKRCMECASESKQLTEKDLVQKMKEIG